MEAYKTKSYDVQGVVLIDEVETHLHVELQKKVLPFLISFFPKIQFIVTTHSLFVINSIENAVICDLEKRIVTEDLSGYSYDTIIESYFNADKYSDVLKEKLEDYERLVQKENKNKSETEKLIE
jgi:predicted ATP-binding protein involved in virulence